MGTGSSLLNSWQPASLMGRQQAAPKRIVVEKAFMLLTKALRTWGQAARATAGAVDGSMAKSCNNRANWRRNGQGRLRGLILGKPWFVRAVVLVFAGVISVTHGGDWIRPGLNTNQPIWGIRSGILWGIAPASFRGGEPRGLIRIGYPVLSAAAYDLVNFIAIEPIVGGRRGFS